MGDRSRRSSLRWRGVSSTLCSTLSTHPTYDLAAPRVTPVPALRRSLLREGGEGFVQRQNVDVGATEKTQLCAVGLFFDEVSQYRW